MFDCVILFLNSQYFLSFFQCLKIYCPSDWLLRQPKLASLDEHALSPRPTFSLVMSSAHFPLLLNIKFFLQPSGGLRRCLALVVLGYYEWKKHEKIPFEWKQHPSIVIVYKCCVHFLEKKEKIEKAFKGLLYDDDVQHNDNEIYSLDCDLDSASPTRLSFLLAHSSLRWNVILWKRAQELKKLQPKGQRNEFEHLTSIEKTVEKKSCTSNIYLCVIKKATWRAKKNFTFSPMLSNLLGDSWSVLCTLSCRRSYPRLLLRDLTRWIPLIQLTMFSITPKKSSIAEKISLLFSFPLFVFEIFAFPFILARFNLG